MDMSLEDFNKVKKALDEAKIPTHLVQIAIVDPKWSEEEVIEILSR